MSRKRRDHKREVLPDPKFGEEIITKFINAMMWKGQRSIPESIFYGALEQVAQKSGVKESESKEDEVSNGVDIFHNALGNIRPLVEVRSRRVGGATYQVPTEVRPSRRDALAIRWLIGAARDRSERTMKDKLAAELFEASQNRGNAVKKKEDTHKMAEANRAFAHYRW